jgi:hypothetical protein
MARNRRKTRLADIRSLGRVDGRVEKDWRSRHKIRKRRAVSNDRNAGLAFASLGAWLRIANDGHHWTIAFPKGSPRVAEWWPSSAKLVLDRQYTRGIHAHTWQQVFSFLRDARQLADAGVLQDGR